MKKSLNAAGVAFVQASELSKTKADLALSVLALHADFDDWMNDRFALHASEQEQLAGMDAGFKALLSETIARELSAGQTISFAKAKPKEKDHRDKDLLISGAQQQSYSLHLRAYRQAVGLQIVIRYH